MHTVQLDNFGGDKNLVISVISLSKIFLSIFFQIKPPFRRSYIQLRLYANLPNFLVHFLLS